jgi:hypothetical protein
MFNRKPMGISRAPLVSNGNAKVIADMLVSLLTQNKPRHQPQSEASNIPRPVLRFSKCLRLHLTSV